MPETQADRQGSETQGPTIGPPPTSLSRTLGSLTSQILRISGRQVRAEVASNSQYEGKA